MAFGRRKLAAVCFLFYLVALVLFLVGFSMSYWVTDYSGKSYHLGLWQFCRIVDDVGTEECIYVVNEKDQLKGGTDYIRATEAFGVMALACALAGGVCVCLWIKFHDKRKFPILAAVFVIATGLLVFLSLIIFGARYSKYNNQPPNGWGFWVFMLGGILFFLLGMIWGVLVMIPSLGFNYHKDKDYEPGETQVPRNYRPPSHPAGLY